MSLFAGAIMAGCKIGGIDMPRNAVAEILRKRGYTAGCADDVIEFPTDNYVGCRDRYRGQSGWPK